MVVNRRAATLSLTAGALFVVLTVLVVVRWPPLMSYDVRTLTAVVDATRDQPGLVSAMRVLSIGLDPLVIRVGLLLVAGLLLWRGMVTTGRWVAVCVVAELVLVTLVKDSVARPRPPEPLPVLDAFGWSFPSGHASGAALLGGVLIVLTFLLVRRTWVRAVAVVVGVGVTLLMGAGRLILGLGAGWNETEFRAFGFPFDHRISRFEEAFTIIRTLLREGSIDFDGRYFQARDCELLPKPARPGGPPLMIGSVGPRMLEITLPHVELWNVWYRDSDNSPAGLEPILRELDAACRKVGRDPATLEKTTAVLVRLPGGTGRIMGDTTQKDVPPVEGSPSQIAGRLREYAALGLAEVQLVVDPITIESVRALGPVLAELDRA